jgi:spore coat protein A
VPLLIQDRNFGLDDSGRLTGQLVHKTDPEVMEAFPPFTVVNGKVWPLQVQPAAGRCRSFRAETSNCEEVASKRGAGP